MQGASRKISITLKSDKLVIQDPGVCSNIMLRLCPESTNKCLALYGTNEADMIALGSPYEMATINENKVIFYVDGETTTKFPPGVVLGQFIVEYLNPLFPSGKQVIKGRGRLFNVII